MTQEEYNRLLKLQDAYENGLISSSEISKEDLLKLIIILKEQIKELTEI